MRRLEFHWIVLPDSASTFVGRHAREVVDGLLSEVKQQWYGEEMVQKRLDRGVMFILTETVTGYFHLMFSEWSLASSAASACTCGLIYS